MLFRQALRLTLFTRPHCSLCDDAKGVLSKVWDRRPFEYDEVNVMEAKQDKWKKLYEFDTPVVCIFLVPTASSPELTHKGPYRRCRRERSRFRNNQGRTQTDASLL